MIASLLAAIIQLTGVTGSDLRARAFFDANNVKVGDPLTLTIDFLGTADFANLHPPALAKVISKTDWKIDDKSAKTDTFRDARRLTYRIRPMRAGVLYFPALEFGYLTNDGAARTVRANEIPVHAKAGDQVALDAQLEDLTKMPDPPELIAEDSSLMPELSPDLAFAWRKALSAPSAEAFAAFDFPAAKLNEASQAITEGDWARALSVYAKLEWRIGQTREIERGIVAALARKFDNPAVELPIWRQIGRPILKYPLLGRLGIVVGALLALSLLLGLLGRGVRALASLALIVFFVTPAVGETRVEESVTTNANGTVIYRKVSYSSQTKGGAGIDPSSLFEDFGAFDPFVARSKKRAPVRIDASLRVDQAEVTRGEAFNLLLTITHPRTVSLEGGVRLSLVEQDCLQQIGPVETLAPQVLAGGTNILRRLKFPMRANVALTNLHYEVAADYAYEGEMFFFRETHPYRSGARTAPLRVKDLPQEGRPANFSGILATGLSLHELCDVLTIETNDVITITYKLRPNGGYVPQTYAPPEVAFEWFRQTAPNGRLSEIEYRRYVVADGCARTPRFEISYYDPEAKAYRTVSTGETPLVYRK